MASSGSFNTTGYSGRYLTFSWTIQNTQEDRIANNRTVIAWTVKGAGGDSSKWFMSGNFKFVIAGTTVYSSATRIQLYSGTVVAKGTVTLAHNSDGTKTFSASAEAGIYNYDVNCAGSANFTIDTIPRATTPTVSGTLSLGSNITISTAGRASTNFTHNIYYSWGTQVIDALIASGVATSKTWTIPKQLAEYIQGGLTGTMFLKCVTYNGSTVIGTTRIPLVISVPDTDEFKPKILGVSLAEANTLPISRYVAGKTQLTVSVTASGATINGSSNRNSFPAKAVITVDGVTYNVNLSQSSPSTWSIKTNAILTAGTQNGSVTITDSRGRTASTTFQFTVFEYSPPVISSFTARRCLPDGTIDESGSYVFFSLKTSVSSVDNLNAKTYKIVYENGGKEVKITSGTLQGYTDNILQYNSYTGDVVFSVDSSWRVRAYVYDSFNAGTPAAVTVIVPTEATFMDWRENGRGIAFGKVSTKDGFESAWEMYDKSDTVITNGLVRYGGSGSSAIDPDTTLEHQILTDKNVPTSGFHYITTMFYSKKDPTANRIQYAMPYNSLGSHYVRYYYNGAWSSWGLLDTRVEAGTSGIWTYRKYASGDAECWGRVEVTTNVSSAWGSLFTSGGISALDVAFPFAFVEPPVVNATLSGNSVGGFLMVTGNVAGGTTTQRTGYYEICRASTVTSGKFIVNFQVKGRWK